MSGVPFYYNDFSSNKPMTELSQRTQAILNAALNTDFENDFTNLDATFEASIKQIVAVVTEALADQVLPDDPYADDCCFTLCKQIRSELLTIATELKSQ